MADKNKFEEFMNSLLNIKAISIIAVIGAIITALVSFLKTANEGYDMIFKNHDATLTSETEFKVNDTLTIKGTVDLFTLIKNLAEDDTHEEQGGIVGDWRAEANNPHITWVRNRSNWARDESQELRAPFFEACDLNSRIGYCILSDDGKPIYNDLDLRVEPGVWSVTYCGSMAGVSRIIIQSEAVGDGGEYDLGPGLTEKIFNGKAKLILLKGIKPESPQGEYFSTYAVEIPNKKKIIITEHAFQWSTGGKVAIMLQ